MTAARYQVRLPSGVIDLQTGAIVLPDASSPAWQAYQDSLTAGLQPLPPDEPVVPVPSAQEIQAEVVAKTQARLDDFARTRNYDNMLSCCTYATSSNATFSAEGQQAVALRDATWAALYAFMAEVESGTRPMPAGFADVAPLLPPLEWLP